MKILLVAMGNPGMSWTPHNIASDLIELVFPIQGKLTILGNLHILVNPDYVNVSGVVVKEYMKKHKISKLIVLVDDIDTKVGKIVTSFGTSHRGHNGIRSIISSLGNQFWKIRIGTGRDLDVSSFVLKKIENKEPFIEICPQLLKCIVETIKVIESAQDNEAGL